MTTYIRLFEAYRDIYCTEFSKQKIQDNVNELWKGFKEDKDGFPSNAENFTKELLIKKTKRSHNFASYFIHQTSKSSPNNVDTSKSLTSSRNVAINAVAPSKVVIPTTSTSKTQTIEPEKGVKRSRSLQVETSNSESECEADRSLQSSNSEQSHRILYTTPAQNKLKAQINFAEKKLLAAIEGRDSGLAPRGIDEEIKKLRKEIEDDKKKLNSIVNKAKRHKKYRDNARASALANKKTNPNLFKHVHEKPGRPSLETLQPELLQTISDIAMFGGAAQDRRRSELIRSCKTLDELQAELETCGFQISRSATYIRLLPRNSNTIEGKKHVKTVPVKLFRAQTNARKDHPDGKFCTASIRSLEQVISTLGSKQAAVLSQDDKSRVPIGLTAANKQAPLLMHLEIKVMLPDHDFVIAPSHKLIPSVYAGIKIEDGKIGDPKNVTYSGPTYVAIRSAKHCSSTAATHAFDFETLLHLDSFREIFYEGEQIKLVVVITSDGGPDENPRYQKVIEFAISHFKTYDLDAMFIITNAPGRSAFNRVERRMAKFSNELAGLVLPHDKYGSHLDNSGKTIDDELEKKNFEFAGKTLAEVWSDMIIDSHPVSAQYVSPECTSEEPIEKVSAEWYGSHVQESQYFLQIVKCDDRQCCNEWRSSLKSILPMSNGFLPPPFPLRRGSDGLLYIPTPEEVKENDSFLDLFTRQAIGLKPVNSTNEFPVPYDFYCPSLCNNLNARICETCGAYFASKKQKNVHTKALHGRDKLEKQATKKILSRRNKECLCVVNYLEPVIEWFEESDVEVESTDFLEKESESNTCIIPDLHNWLLSPFVPSDGFE